MLPANDRPCRGCTSRVAAINCSIASALPADANSHSHTPSRNSGRTSPATCTAKRVFPTPPTPVRVTARDSLSVLIVARTSAVRPTNELSCTGKFPGNASTERSDANSDLSPSEPT